MNAFLPILVCLCGGLGASARYVCDSYIKACWHRAFPMSTFVINVIAGFLAGIVAGLYARSVVAQAARHRFPRWILDFLNHDERNRHLAARR